MKRTMLLLAAIAACVVRVDVLRAQERSPAAQQSPAKDVKTYALAGTLVRGYHSIQTDLVDTAEKMPDQYYGFKPTPEIKPFGQLVVHVALAQFRSCAMLKGE